MKSKRDNTFGGGKVFVVGVIVWVAVGFIAAHVAHIATTSHLPTIDAALGALANPLQILNSITTSFLPPLTEEVVLSAALAGAAALVIVVQLIIGSIHKYRRGEEEGSARWGTYGQAKKFANLKEKSKNLILSKRIKLAFNPRSLKYARNLNVFVVGGSGSGKTEFVIKPNILQSAHETNFLVNDPKGTVIKSMGGFLEHLGIEVRQFNTVDFASSSCFNPFEYVKTDSDLQLVINNFMVSTTPDNSQASDPFWEKSEINLYTSCLSLLRDYFPNDFNFPMLLKLISWAKVDEDNKAAKSKLELLFEELETGVVQSVKDDTELTPVKLGVRDIAPKQETLRQEPSLLVNSRTGREVGRPDPKTGRVGIDQSDDISLDNFKGYTDAPQPTRDSILASVRSRLSVLKTEEVKHLLTKDEMGLKDLSDPNKKVAIFLTSSDVNNTYAFLSSLMVSLTIEMLNQEADITHGGRLPKPVGLYIDELPNQYIAGIERVVATCRSRNFFIQAIAQSKSQLAVMYDKNVETIIDCCDTMIFLGGKSQETTESISKMIGKETFMTTNVSYDSKGNRTLSKQAKGRDLMSPDEIAQMDKMKSIILISGSRPFLDQKFVPKYHKNYKYINPGHKGVWRWRGLLPRFEKPVFDKEFDYLEYRKRWLEAQESTESDNSDVVLMQGKGSAEYQSESSQAQTGGRVKDKDPVRDNKAKVLERKR